MAEEKTSGWRDSIVEKYLLFKSANQGEKITNQPVLQRSDMPPRMELNGQPALFP